MAKILIVDDEAQICEEFGDLLRDAGHEVETALNGIDALEKVGKDSYDLIFLDVLMPRMEGREVFEKIKKIRAVPVAIMSGYIPPNKEKEVLALGAIACLKKPLDFGRIRSLISSLKPQQK